MLIDADEQLLHQVALPFSQAGTTDHRFYDRFIFGGWDNGAGIGFLAGLGVYKNLGTTDGFLVTQNAGQQHNLRMADSVSEEPGNGVVGPLCISILEPYRQASITVGPNESGMECDLIWSTAHGVHHEPALRTAGTSGSSTDYTRYNQSGAVNGWLRFCGHEFEVRNWWGFRDHSWGVRPGVGGFDAKPWRQSSERARALLMSLYYDTAEYSCHMIRIEDAQGRKIYQHGTLIAHGERCFVMAELRDWEHDIQFVEDGKGYRAFLYRTIWSDGREIEIKGLPTLSAWFMRGAGYDRGFADGLGLGAQRGSVIEHDIVSLHSAAAISGAMHFEQPAALVVNGQHVSGYAPVLVYPKAD